MIARLLYHVEELISREITLHQPCCNVSKLNLFKRNAIRIFPVLPYVPYVLLDCPSINPLILDFLKIDIVNRSLLEEEFDRTGM